MAKKVKGYKMGKEAKKAFSSLMSKQPETEQESLTYKMDKSVKSAMKSAISKNTGMAADEGREIRGYESVFAEKMGPGNAKPQYSPVDKSFNRRGYDGSDTINEPSEDDIEVEAASRRSKGLPVDTEEGETTKDSYKRWKRGK